MQLIPGTHKKYKFDKTKVLLQQSQVDKDKYILTYPPENIVIIFKKGEFEETAEIKILYDKPKDLKNFLELLYFKYMKSWLLLNHPKIYYK